MPCPYFEPDAPLTSPTFENGRLPLIEEYSGQCVRAGDSHRAHECTACNQGYARGRCENFPEQQKNGAFRYSLVGREGDQLEILWISEEEYFPVSSHRLHFSIAGNCVIEKEFDSCIQAQAAAFCRSYLRKVCLAR